MIDSPGIGTVIRKVRMERNIKQLELAKLIKCTPSALSKFERQEINLEQEKVNVIMQKLGITHDDIPSILERIEEEKEIRLLVFLGIESSVKQNLLLDGDYAEFTRQLSFINDPLLETYLRGKRFFKTKSFDNAVKHYQEVVNVAQDDLTTRVNLQSAAYLDLGIIAYECGEYTKMFNYYEQGIKHFNHAGERHHILYNLHYNKALSLHDSGEITEGSRSDIALEPAWEHRSEINDVLTKIKVHQLKASIKMNSGKTIEARKILHEALIIANANRSADGAYYVLVDLANLAIQKGQLVLGEETYLSAIRYTDKLVYARATSAYLGISRLYLSQGDTKKAREYIANGLKFANKHNVHKQIQARMLYGEIFEADGNLYDASLQYKEAKNLAHEYELDQYKVALYDSLFRCRN